jgi:RNA polymerase sigma-70 factor (ECF subfamily)
VVPRPDRFVPAGRGGFNGPVHSRIHSKVSGTVLSLSGASARDEASLIARARAGDRDAQDALIGRYVRDVYETTARVLGDRDLAEDAAQDAFVNALHGLDRFRAEASFKTWLLRIALNSARSLARRRGRKREVGLALVENTPVDEVDGATAATIRDEARRVSALLERLPTKQRMAVSLRVNQGLSYQEIGAVLECSEGAARVNYHLGIKRLREWTR